MCVCQQNTYLFIHGIWKFSTASLLNKLMYIVMQYYKISCTLRVIQSLLHEISPRRSRGRVCNSGASGPFHHRAGQGDTVLSNNQIVHTYRTDFEKLTLYFLLFIIFSSEILLYM